jgi:hypothetical protein
MKVIIATASGPIVWESCGGDADEVARLVENWNRWVAGQNPQQFAHIAHDRGAFNVWYRDIISIDIS